MILHPTQRARSSSFLKSCLPTHHTCGVFHTRCRDRRHSAHSDRFPRTIHRSRCCNPCTLALTLIVALHPHKTQPLNLVHPHGGAVTVIG